MPMPVIGGVVAEPLFPPIPPDSPQYEFLVFPSEPLTPYETDPALLPIYPHYTEGPWVDVLTWNLTAYLSQNNAWEVDQQWSRQGDTAAFYLRDSHPGKPLSFIIPLFSSCRLKDVTIPAAPVVLFDGVINDPVLNRLAPGLMEWELQCLDFTFFANSAVVQGEFESSTLDQVVIGLTTDFHGSVFPGQSSTYGITASSTLVGGHVWPGPPIDLLRFPLGSLSDALALCTQYAAGLTNEPWGWRVDYNHDLWFYPLSAVPQLTDSAPIVLITDNGAAADSWTTAHADQSSFNYEWNGTDVRNQVYCLGSAPLQTWTDNWLGDGITSQWLLSYPLDSSSAITLSVNGVAATVAVANGSAPTTDYVVTQNLNGEWVLTPAPITGLPAVGWPIDLTYSYDQGIESAVQALYITLGDNPYDMLPNEGRFGEVLTDSSLDTLDAVRSSASRELVEYQYPLEQINLTTTEGFFGNIYGGDVVHFHNDQIPDSQNGWAQGIDDYYLVTSSTIAASSHGGGWRTYAITATRLILGPQGTRTGGMTRAKTIQDLLWQLNSDSMAALPTGVQATLENLASINEAFDLSDTLSVTTTLASTQLWDAGTWGLIEAT